jgi:hypothetical protein
MITIIRWVHILAGVVALGALWIPLVARKGGRVHRRAGWVYACAMWVAALGAWGLCAARLLDDERGNDATALFLAFVGLLAASGAGTGIRILRTKSRSPTRASAFDVTSSSLVLAASVALSGFGIFQQSVLYVAFGVLGAFLSLRQLKYWLRAPITRMDWWFAHMGNMLAACIGTVTAFAVVNVPRFGLERYALFLWLGPGVLGGIAIAVWTRFYRRKFARASARRPGSVEATRAVSNGSGRPSEG